MEQKKLHKNTTRTAQNHRSMMGRLLLVTMLLFTFLGGAKAQALFSEDFEGGSMPEGWTTDGPGTWSVGTGDYSSSTGAGQGTYNALIKHGTTGNATKLITPEIDLSTVTSAELSFMHIQRSWAGDYDQLKVYYRTSSAGEWTQLVEYTSAVATWTTEDGIVLPNLSSTYQIAFEMTDKYGYGVGVDEVKIVQGASCPKPAGLNVTTNALTATFTWQSDADWFEIAHSTNADANPDDAITAVATTNSYNFTDLALGDHYVWVRTVCGTTEQSGWAGPLSFHIGYCVPAPTSVDNDGISNVTFGTGDNVVNNDTPKATYADYSNLVGAVQAGIEATIAITFKTSYTYNTYVWVDLDNSLSFDADEVVCYGESTSSNPTTLTLNFTIPATQALGDYRMRIGSADSGLGSDPASANPCYTGSYACFQDYTLRVLEAPSCLTPTGLAVTTDGASATATWNGTADTYNIDINGTVTNNVTSPYTFDVELSTTYEVSVQANCGGGEISDWTNPVSITTPDCIGGHVIEYTLTDSYGDGWGGGTITVIEGCGDIVKTLTVTTSSNSGTLTLCGDYYEFVWQAPSQYAGECEWTFTENGTTIFSGSGYSASDGQVLYTLGTTTPKPTSLAAGTPGTNEVELSWTENGTATAWQICVNNDMDNLIDVRENPYTLTGLTADTDYSVMVRAYIDETTQSCWSAPVTFTTAISCARPENLAEANITTNGATLSWEGTNDSYVLQYRPWHQVGEDKTATATLATYNYDLSEYSGTGSIAIRHYDVTDMFVLNVDDIVVKNAAGTTVYTQDFESGTIPFEITNMDLDGDGYVWGIRENANDDYGNPSGNGTYCASSASWYSGTALNPDNWLIISGIELGGSISFAARGQDPSYPAENFAVYVSAEADLVEVPLTATTYTAEGLEPGTPYAWQVKGVCGTDDASRWVSSFFKTKDDILVFATDGDWNEVSNWTDAEGNAITELPTIENKVRIDADATIPAGVVANAGKTTINGGSITIADGGQLKHKAATLKVTMNKNITGYGEGTGNYKLISSPFTGITLIGDNGNGWSYVDITGDGYDLYGFASTEDNEWINNESSSDHAVFTSGNNHGLRYGDGYLYANEADKSLEFTGTAALSVNSTITADVTYDATSTDVFNGWKLVGNPFTCNGYLMFGDAEGNMVNATFYKMNAAGDGYEKYENYVMLAPGEGAFMKYSTSGKVYFFSDDQGWTITSSGTGDIPVLPAHGEATDQDANPSLLILADNAANNSTLINAAAEAGGVTNVMLADRTLYKDGYWNTLCLPFDYDLNVDGNVLAGATLMELNGTTSNLTGSILTLNFETATSISAGVPYIIKWAASNDVISSPTFTGVTINKDASTEVSFVGGKFVGTYNPVTYNTETKSILFVGVDEETNESKLYWPNPADAEHPVVINAFRAYFDVTDGSKIRAFRLNFGENGGEATGIMTVNDSRVMVNGSGWYTVDGRKLLNAPKRKGVYIHNGVKVTIK